MPRTCTICRSPDRPKIDTAIATNSATIRDIARQYRVTKDALIRHRDSHLREALVRAAERKRDREDDSLLGRVDHLWNECVESMRLAKTAGRLEVVPALVAQGHKNCELRGQITGELGQPNTTAPIQIAFA